MVKKLLGGDTVGNSKFFDKSISPACAYCLEGRPLSGGEEIFCMKHGVTKPLDRWRSYRYDPLKRVPRVKDIGRDYDPKDFKL